MSELTPQQKAAQTRKKNKEAKEQEDTQTVTVVDAKHTQAFSVSREKDGWYFTTTYLEGDQVLKQDKVGPTMRAIVLDEFKMTAQRYFESMER